MISMTRQMAISIDLPGFNSLGHLVTPIFSSSMRAHAQAMNEYREVDGSGIVLTTPPPFLLIKVQINLDLAAINKHKGKGFVWCNK